MAKRHWWGLPKCAEEPAELIVELMKLETFPDGKHPARKRSLVLSTEDELADTLAIIEYFIDRNKLDRARIEKRKLSKYKKFSRWWGLTPKQKMRALKKSTKAKISRSKRTVQRRNVEKRA